MIEMISIAEALLEWDGKSADDIRDIYHQHKEAEDFISQLIAALHEVPLQKAASWLIKHSLEEGTRLTNDQSRHLFQLLDKLQHWESCLHVLQSMPYMSIPQTEIQPLEHFLRHSLTADNKFVRAWSYNGFYELASQYPGDQVAGQPRRQKECMQFFDLAMQDEAPSVKARIRNLMKKAFK